MNGAYFLCCFCFFFYVIRLALLVIHSENGFLFEEGSLLGAFFGWYGVVASVVFCFLHHSLMGGIKLAAVLFVAQGASFLSGEFLDANGIAVFGPHTYSEKIPTLSNGVPLGVSVALYLQVYCVMVLGNAILHGSAKAKRDPRMPLSQIIFISFCQSLLLIALDIVMEPVGVAAGMDSWQTKSGCSLYFGVPLSNFLGWFWVSFPPYLIHNLLANKIGKDQPPRPDVLANLPIVTLCCFYVWLQCVISKVGLGVELQLVSCFTLGMPISISIYQICYGDKQADMKLSF